MNNTQTDKSICIPSVKLLGDYWSLRIIDELSRGEQRFCSIQRALDNINPVTLTDRLKKLEFANVVKRNEETVDKLSVSYTLTGLGLQALPIIAAVNNFAVEAKLS